MLAGPSFAYNGVGLLLEMIGLLLVLIPGKIINSRSVDGYQTNAYFASPIRLEQQVNTAQGNQSQTQTYTAGIFVIILGLFSSFLPCSNFLFKYKQDLIL